LKFRTLDVKLHDFDSFIRWSFDEPYTVPDTVPDTAPDIVPDNALHTVIYTALYTAPDIKTAPDTVLHTVIYTAFYTVPQHFPHISPYLWLTHLDLPMADLILSQTFLTLAKALYQILYQIL
jgi:hypothetical protein